MEFSNWQSWGLGFSTLKTLIDLHNLSDVHKFLDRMHFLRKTFVILIA